MTRRILDYESRTTGQWADILRGRAGRPPRVLLVTSRFTTVLQHATRDAAEAFEHLGWETRLLIEPSAYQRLTTWCVQQVLSEFRPDLVFVIDHLRSGLPGRYPKQLPFVCWIQDDLSHLATTTAGRSISQRDFVLTCAAKLYSEKFEYPLRQCIYSEKFTRVPQRPVSWDSDGDDLVFVSNASRHPKQIMDEVISEVTGGSSAKEMVRRCCDRVLRLYHEDQCVPGLPQMAQIIDEACQDVGGFELESVVRTNLIMRLFNGLNNTLYRQQAIRWAVQVAQELDLTLALYGQGWEKNEEFAQYAKGPVAYGRDLEELTRRSKINLQIVPFSCLHQRLLDGLVAGGFFLIREHPFDRLHEALGTWLVKLDPSIRCRADLHQLPVEQKQAMDEWLRSINALTLEGDTDPIETYRQHVEQRCGFLYESLPQWDEVTFDRPESLRRQVQHYLGQPSLRQAVAVDQKRFVEASRTYESGLQRVLGRIADLIQTERASDRPIPDEIAV